MVMVVAPQGDSSEAAASKGRNELSAMIDHFSIRPREASLEAALRLYKLALAQGFTKGRVVGQVAACCLYIICRLDTKPFMLLDYSDLLQVGGGENKWRRAHEVTDSR
jgi:transcription factor IIIB subunit 2